MKTQQVPISQVQIDPHNPRILSKEKFEKLKTSIQEFPEMLKVRPLVVADGYVIGGNMRLLAMKDLGYREVYIIDVTDWTKTQRDEFMIKDNVSFGEWDWDMLGNEWNTIEIAEWGLDVWQNPDDKNLLDAELEWTDMPEYAQEDLTPSRQIIVSFRNEKDVQAFAKLLGQKITDKTKSVWHPFAENVKQFDKTYE